MVYVGSKSRLSKYIVPILQKYIDINNVTTYIEPFVGGANIIDKINCENRIGYDIHEGLIGIFNAVKNGFIPPSTITETEYNNAKKGLISEPLRSYIGFQGSYATKYWGGFARGFKADGITPRDIYNERTRNFKKQIPNLLDIHFEVKNFLDINTENSLIYCDPPYKNTTEYSTGGFNHNLFWNWVKNLSNKNIVIVSEFQAPTEFKSIWEKERNCSLDKDTGAVKKIEKLFIYENIQTTN